MSYSTSTSSMSDFVDTNMTMLRDDLARNSNAFNSLFAKLRDIEDPSINDVLNHLRTREEILSKQISELFKEKQKLKQDIIKESSSLVSSHRLILIAALCTAVIVSVSVFYAISLVSAQENQILQEKTERLNMVSTQLENNIIKLRSVAEASSHLPQVQDVSFANLIDKKLHGIPSNADPQKREAANDILRANKDILAVFFVMPNGDMYLSQPYYGQENMKDYNFAFRDWYKGVTKTHQTYVSELYITQVTNTKAVAIATPVYSDSKYVGMWCLVLNADYFASPIQQNSLEQNEQLVIVDKNNHIVYDSTHIDFANEKISSLDYVNMPEGLDTEKLTNTIQTVNGVKSLVLTFPVHTGNDHWTAALIQPYDDVFAPKNVFNEPLIVTMLFVGIVLMISVTIILNTFKKSKQIQTNIMQLGQYDQSLEVSDDAMRQTVERKIALNNKVYALIIIAISLLGVNAYLHFVPQQTPEVSTQMKSGFVIENLRGDTVGTWTSWNILPDTTLNIRFVNPDDINEAQLTAIKDSILSEKSLFVDDSITHKGPKGQESEYYDGWTGALRKASKEQTKFVIPNAFHITDSSQGEGDIIFHFSTAKSVDGYTGYTNDVVDQNQILKATITIYDVDELTPEQIGTIARHEFGHALGLAHSSAPEDLMAPVITTPVPFISECDVDAIRSLYDGNKQNQVTCEK